MKSTLSPLAPIFLFSNWRTAGTALAFSFRKVSDFCVFTEPFNPTLKNPDLALASKTSLWDSKHPCGEYYFSEYAKLLLDGSLNFPDLETIPYVLKESDVHEDLKRYFEGLIKHAHSTNKIPVFKLEQSEGSVAWMRLNFPDSLFVGVTRNSEYQFMSWLEQATYGNHASFFGLARQLINKNPNFFESAPISAADQVDFVTYQEVFSVFRRKIDIQHELFMDFCIDVSPESRESLSEKLSKVKSNDPSRVELWECVLSSVNNSLLKETESQSRLRALKIQVNYLSKLSKINEALEGKIISQIEQSQVDSALARAEIEKLQFELTSWQSEAARLSTEISESWGCKKFKILKEILKKNIK